MSSGKVLSTSPLAPCNWSPGFIMAFAYVNGFILKYGDVIGDRELLISDEQYDFHSQVAIVLMSVTSILFAMANIECCFMTAGAVMACLATAKLDCIEHVIPGFACLIAPIVILLIFKDAPWHNIELTRDNWERGMVVAGQLLIFGSFEEWCHEEFDDHPNPYINLFFDLRPINFFITYGFYWLSTKNMLVPKKFNKLVDWWTIFTNTLLFGIGYETFRSSIGYINSNFLS